MSRSVLAFVMGAQLLVELPAVAGLKVDYSVDAGAVRRELHSAHCTPAIRHRNDYEGETDIVPLNLYASRTHGWSILNENHRLIDLSFVFPCPDLDPEDASSYDFVASDYQLGLARNKAKLKVFYRLGVTEEYCRGSHYHTQVPEDFAVTAGAMAGVVRHYSGAWLDGKKDKITYWEIWNGPDDTEHNWHHDGWTAEQHRAAFAEFTVTNSPSMDIRKSSNVERLLWMISGGLDGDVAGACAETARMMGDLETMGRYELSEEAKARLMSGFVGGVATPEETEAEMRRMREACGYLLDPHTAVATCVAKKLGYPRDGVPCVVAATATPYKFPETCRRAFGADVLTDPPPSFRDLETLPIAQKKIVEIGEIDQAVRDLF